MKNKLTLLVIAITTSITLCRGNIVVRKITVPVTNTLEHTGEGVGYVLLRIKSNEKYVMISSTLSPVDIMQPGILTNRWLAANTNYNGYAEWYGLTKIIGPECWLVLENEGSSWHSLYMKTSEGGTNATQDVVIYTTNVRIMPRIRHNR